MAERHIKTAQTKRIRAQKAYYDNPNYCTFCGKVISIPEGYSPKYARVKKYCNSVCCSKHQIKRTNDRIQQGLRVERRSLKRYVIETQGYKCSICDLTEWRGQPVSLVMDHINGNPEDDRPENLRLVCGNCDMQLPTYKGKNVGNGRHYRRQRYKEGKSY